MHILLLLLVLHGLVYWVGGGASHHIYSWRLGFQDFFPLGLTWIQSSAQIWIPKVMEEVVSMYDTNINQFLKNESKPSLNSLPRPVAHSIVLSPHTCLDSSQWFGDQAIEPSLWLTTQWHRSISVASRHGPKTMEWAMDYRSHLFQDTLIHYASCDSCNHLDTCKWLAMNYKLSYKRD